MSFARREFVILGGVTAVAGLSGCLGPSAANLTVKAVGTPGMNPGPDGADRPLTLTIVQMTGTGAFDSADYFALQNPAAALGTDFVRADQIIVSGATPVTKVISVQPGVAAVGVVAGFRSPAGKNFRSRVPAPKSSGGLTVTVGAGGISVA
ncbi:type VI secretion system lipoprotein TssJ [Ruegeria marina]|uniref:Type VI secretion system protein VasD n=1 Tax=Ruegeria marina TaxID=639004 RepID=A0A1G7CX57_9RHOB|nr:type VI secretion system lipoprotein TssJ [Ruegeria marina]SDE43879.1 type VI secretion system protein VasD [Ruegeria marina]